MRDLKVWMRVGDQDDYHDFDSVDEAAEDMAGLLEYVPVPTLVRRYVGNALVGVEIPEAGLLDYNSVSLYWGDDDAQLEDALADCEIEGFQNVLLAAS